MLVRWHFEPRQPRTITSGLKTMFNLSPVYAASKSSHNKLSKNHKISPDTNLQKTYTKIKHRIFEELVPSVLPLLKKHVRLGHTGIMHHSISVKKEWTDIK